MTITITTLALTLLAASPQTAPAPPTPPTLPAPMAATAAAPGAYSWTSLIETLGLAHDEFADGRFLVAAVSDDDLDDVRDRIEEAVALFDDICPATADSGRGTVGIMLQLADQRQLDQVLSRVAELAPWMQGWTATMRGASGFTLGDPLVAAWVDGGPGQEEWSSEHELVHRTSELLTLQRFGQLPYWIAQGLAWRLEYGVHESVYCFPYRNGFVPVGDHEDWPRQLEKRFKKRRWASDHVRFRELAALQRGRYDQTDALLAYGTLQFLGDEDPAALSGWLADLVAHRAEHGRIVHEDGSWETIPGYEVALEDQERMLLARFGEGLYEDLTKAFRKGVD